MIVQNVLMGLQCHYDSLCELILQELYRKIGVIFKFFSYVFAIKMYHLSLYIIILFIYEGSPAVKNLNAALAAATTTQSRPPPNPAALFSRKPSHGVFPSSSPKRPESSSTISAESSPEAEDSRIPRLPDGLSPRKKPRKQTLAGNEMLESQRSSDEEFRPCKKPKLDPDPPEPASVHSENNHFTSRHPHWGLGNINKYRPLSKQTSKVFPSKSNLNGLQYQSRPPLKNNLNCIRNNNNSKLNFTPMNSSNHKLLRKPIDSSCEKAASLSCLNNKHTSSHSKSSTIHRRPEDKPSRILKTPKVEPPSSPDIDNTKRRISLLSWNPVEPDWNPCKKHFNTHAEVRSKVRT